MLVVPEVAGSRRDVAAAALVQDVRRTTMMRLSERLDVPTPYKVWSHEITTKAA